MKLRLKWTDALSVRWSKSCLELARVDIPHDLRQRIRDAKSVTVMTGAGVSAESGVPTFRDAQTGLWEKYDPMQLATPEAFHSDPGLVWDWYQWRRKLIADTAPNPGHVALVDMARLIPELVLVTQNVDGLHQRAGSENPVELHGNLNRAKCTRCSRQETGFDLEGIPKCGECGALLRPDVVWFGEALPTSALRRATESALRCELFFSIGTSSQVYPAADLPLQAQAAGALTLEINPQVTPLSDRADYVLRGTSGEVLPALVQQVWS